MAILLEPLANFIVQSFEVGCDPTADCEDLAFYGVRRLCITLAVKWSVLEVVVADGLVDGEAKCFSVFGPCTIREESPINATRHRRPLGPTSVCWAVPAKCVRMALTVF